MFNPFHRFRIDYVLFLVFAGFLAVLVTLIMAISYTLTSRTQLNNTIYYQQGMLTQLNKELTLQLKSVEQTSLALTLNNSIIDFLVLKGDYYTRNEARKTVSQNYLTPVVNSSTSIQSIQVYMEDPTVIDVQADVQFLPLRMLAEQPWYEAARKSDFTWVGEHIATSSQGGMPVVSIVRKLTSHLDVNLGYLVINIKIKALQSVLSEDHSNTRRILLDSGGRLMFRTASAPGLPAVTGLLAGNTEDTGYRRVRLHDDNEVRGGTDSLMVWTRDFREGWMLVELTPWNQIRSSSLQLAAVLALVGGIALVVASFVTLYLSRNFTAPVRELLALMNAYSISRTMRPFPTRYRNEFGSLFSGYRRMIERIEELYASLERQYKAQREAEIRALQAMINPHFLYNTLDQLNWMAIEAGHERMSQVLELMGRMFRIGLSNGESFITVEDELLHTECYLRIQQLKWGDALQYDIAGGERFAECYIPKLTLQPFVENAILHGLHGRREGRIEVRLEEAEGGLLIRITDNGIGLPANWSMRKRRKTGGYGIRNVVERIEAYFGPPFGVELEALQGGYGTQVRIRIPRLQEKPGGSNDQTKGSEAHVDDRNRG